MSLRDVDSFNQSLLSRRWGDLNGLQFDQRIGNGDRALLPLIDRRKPQLVAKIDELRNLSHSIFDHAHLFRSGGAGGRIVAVVTAPYLGVVMRHLGSTTELNKRVNQIARDLGLFVRVGHPADTIYMSVHAAEPTIPIVWWNPEHFELDIPLVNDPYPSFADQ